MDRGRWAMPRGVRGRPAREWSFYIFGPTAQVFVFAAKAALPLCI